MATYLSDLAFFKTRKTPDAEALMDWSTGVRYTWRDMERRRERMERFLVHKLGVKKGDRVGFLCPNCMSMIDAFFASYTTGIIVDTYNHRLLATELVHMAKDEKPRVLFFSNACRAKASEVKDALGEECSFVCTEDILGPENEYTIADIDRIGDKLPSIKRCSIERDDPQLLIHTGGTTGFPKAAKLTFHSIFMNAMAEILSWRLSEDDVAVTSMPLYHTAGWNVLLISTLLIGGRVVLLDEFTPDAFLDIVEQERPTVMMGADAMFKTLAQHPRFADVDFLCFKWMNIGGSPGTLAAMEPYWNRGIKVFVGYGMTEVGPNNISPDVSMTIEDIRKKPHSVGKPLSFNEVRIVDEEGRDVAQGECGELLIRGELVFGGYWNREDETRALFSGDWVHTGDIGFMDEDGDITIRGRSKNVYISGGENIFPVEIERIIEMHPAVSEACVFGIPDERWGEVGKALIVLYPGCTLAESELKEFLDGRISTIKKPRVIQFVSEVPKNSAGKRDGAAINRLYGVSE